MKLSILICTLHKRKHLLNELLDSLDSQISSDLVYTDRSKGSPQIIVYSSEEVEIITATDNKQITVGAKRNLLLKEASGKYVTFIDDDDSVTETYIKDLLFSTQFNFDAVMFHVIYNPKGGNKKLVRYSVKCEDAELDTHFTRKPNHLMMVKRELALQAGFKDMRRGEDFDYANRLSKLIKKEGHLNKVLYYYNFDMGKTETQ